MFSPQDGLLDGLFANGFQSVGFPHLQIKRKGSPFFTKGKKCETTKNNR